MQGEDEQAPETSGAQADVIVDTLEALQARVAESDREPMRGAIAPERPAARRQHGDTGPRWAAADRER